VRGGSAKPAHAGKSLSLAIVIFLPHHHPFLLPPVILPATITTPSPSDTIAATKKKKFNPHPALLHSLHCRSSLSNTGHPTQQPPTMPAATKTTTSTKEKDRRKSAGKTSPSLVTLKVPADSLRKILAPSPATEEESPAKESPAHESPATSTTLPVETAATASNGDAADDSTPGTPAASGTPSQVPMGPPTESIKKKGIKRAAPGANGSEPKARGKPGPKKKPRL
jgi:hypothetical protein